MADIPPRGLSSHLEALANPTRLTIVSRLAEKPEMTVNELANSLRMSQPRVSWHLRMLRLGGVIKQRREGREVYCSLDRDQIRTMHRRLMGLIEGPGAAGGRAPDHTDAVADAGFEIGCNSSHRRGGS